MAFRRIYIQLIRPKKTILAMQSRKKYQMLCGHHVARPYSHRRLPLGQRPRLRAHDLPLAVGPKVHARADEHVQARVGGLVHEDGGQRGQRVVHQTCLYAPVHAGAGDELERVLVGQTRKAEDQVDDLQDGDGLDGAVEVGAEEVPEYLGPEEAFYGG